ncbi:hypothetical protein TNCV_1065031 [Trichonephila clavipes]|nr:hypothetical protein TNCV_1065031 [Trichonephila clavipes]
MSLSSFRVQQDTNGQQSSASTEKLCLIGKKVTNTQPPADVVGCRCHRFSCTKTQPDCRIVPRRKNLTNTHRRADAVGCRCHRSACTKTRPNNRVLPRRKKGDENPTSLFHGRMSLPAFHVHQDTMLLKHFAFVVVIVPRAPRHDRTAEQCLDEKKVTNTHRRADAVAYEKFSSFRSACTKTRPDSRVLPRRKNMTNTHRPATAVGCRCHRSACTKRDRTTEYCLDGKNVTNILLRSDAVGCRCQRSAFTKMRPGSRIVPLRKKGDENPTSLFHESTLLLSLSSFRVHQDTTGQKSSVSTKKVTNTHRRAAAVGCRCHRSACRKTRPNSRVVSRRKKGYEHPPSRVRGRMSLSSFRVHQDATTAE